MSALAVNLRAQRVLAQLSCRELDRRAGLGEGHTALIESGERRNVQLETLRALATALGINIGALIG